MKALVVSQAFFFGKNVLVCSMPFLQSSSVRISEEPALSTSLITKQHLHPHVQHMVIWKIKCQEPFKREQGLVFQSYSDAERKLYDLKLIRAKFIGLKATFVTELF